MTKYRYVARRGGVDERGTMEAPNKSDVVRKLKAEGYDRVRVRRAPTDTGGLFRRFFPTR